MTYLTRFSMVLAFIVLGLTTSSAAPQVIGWDDLVPEKGDGIAMSIPMSEARIGMLSRQEFDGDDQDYADFVEAIEYQRYSQPQGAKVNTLLDGMEVRLPGYITPVGFNDQAKLTEFLLVPYLGACIHVPPPPGNQIVYISDATGFKESQLYEPIWVVGILRATGRATILADTGYRIEGARIEPYN